MLNLQNLARLLVCALALSGLGGCKTLPGESSRDEEFARLRAEGGFAIVEAETNRVVFAAMGADVVVEPQKGYCLDGASVAVTGEAAFALVADCMHDHLAVEQAKAEGAGGHEILLPRAFPGILTISVSGEPAYGPTPSGLDEFEALIRSASGRNLLSRGNNSAPGTIIGTKRIGGALYVLAEEPTTSGLSILAPRYWRAFAVIKDRLVLATVSGFRDHSIAEDAMLGFLAGQLAQLRRANGMRADREEDEIAQRMAGSFEVAATPEAISPPEPRVAKTAQVGSGPARAPAAPRRGADGGDRKSGSAPSRAPAPPRRTR